VGLGFVTGLVEVVVFVLAGLLPVVVPLAAGLLFVVEAGVPEFAGEPVVGVGVTAGVGKDVSGVGISGKGLLRTVATSSLRPASDLVRSL
jgi:hypothetical protein